MKEFATFFENKKAQDILLLDLSQKNTYLNYFLIVSANSPLHLRALSKEFYKEYPDYTKGLSHRINANEIDSGWLILDLIDVVIHIFLEDERQYYNLEKLWGDAKMILDRSKKSEKIIAL